MEDLVFVGSKAVGYYSGVESYIGVFVSEKQYEKYKELFHKVFEDYRHGEIDGKHSDVLGDLLMVGFNSAEGVVSFVSEASVDYEIYNFTERHVDGYRCPDTLVEHLKNVYKRIIEVVAAMSSYTLVLTEDEHGAVSEFVEELRKGR